ncbi:MAG TPA: protein kinase [Terriglobales bacterium]|nr:protein kinase [Terriglobales bacterium]
MALSAGTKLGPYEVLAPIGAGGMGEVYRARDTRLERTVAIKVLPGHLSSDPERKQRFEREAKTISSLQHPHICTLYDVGNQDDVDYLVMELLEGETLGFRLLRGALPTEQVLRIGMEVADALDKAHRQGVVHRDLKPGNIMLTKSGAKLLDFGLAKPGGLPKGSSALSAALTAPSPVSPVGPSTPLTEKGMVVGTFQYMAPEQIEGKEADARTDIFALGAVLYELSTGKRAFDGKSQLSVASAILEKEPVPITSIQPLAPAALEHVVGTCLAKDPEERWQSAADIRQQLKWIAEGGSTAAAAAVRGTKRKTREWLAWAVAGMLLVVALAAWMVPGRGEPRYPVRFELSTPGAVYESVVSPSGRQIAYVMMEEDGHAKIRIRALDTLESRVVPGSEDAGRPFWSRDEQFLGFFSRSKLKKVELSTGSVQTLAEVGGVGGAVGGAWGDGAIVYGPRYGSGLYRVSTGGGDATPLTQLDASKRETVHGWPQFLPDGKHFVFLNRSAPGEVNHICAGSVDSKQWKALVDGDTVVGYVEPGYLLFIRSGALMAQGFDAGSLAVKGQPFVVVDKVGFDANLGRAQASISNDTLIYQTGLALRDRELVLLDRAGKQVAKLAPAGPYAQLRVSPDGKSVAVDRVESETGAMDIWVWERERNVFSRLTTNPSNDRQAAWSVHERGVAFSSDRKGMYDIYLKTPKGEEEVLLESGEDKYVGDWSRDGRYLVYVDSSPKAQADIWALPMTGEHKPFPVVQTKNDEKDPRLSPNGSWLSYTSDRSGKPEVYVTAFPSGEGLWQVSNSGGSQARWSPDGKEMFYLSDDRKLMVVEIKPGKGFEPGMPKTLFTAPDGGYAPVERGQFIFSSLVNEGRTSPINVVMNWTATLRKK